MKNKVKYTVHTQDFGTQIVFDTHKSCSCGIDYKAWDLVKENEYGYWFDCPICRSTLLAPKDYTKEF